MRCCAMNLKRKRQQRQQQNAKATAANNNRNKHKASGKLRQIAAQNKHREDIIKPPQPTAPTSALAARTSAFQSDPPPHPNGCPLLHPNHDSYCRGAARQGSE